MVEYDFDGVACHNSDFPDVDSDFSSSTKDSVKDYFAEKYGKDNICSIGTIGFLRTKSVLKELARVHDVPPDEVNELTTVGMSKFEADDEELSLDELRQKFPALDSFLDRHPLFEKDMSKLQGTINCWGVHAGGVLISDRPLIDQLPVRVKDGKLVSVWTEGLHGRELGMMGFIKLDILAIETLDVIEEAIDLINRRYGRGLRFEDIPLGESNCLKRIGDRKNLGVFQFETELALRTAQQMGGLHRFEDIPALSTLMRPAALQNKFPEKFGYRRDHPSSYFVPECMKKFIGKEMGLPIYQEAAYFFGMNLSDFDRVSAYKFMKMLYKGKMTKDKIPYWRERFIKGCIPKIRHREYGITFSDGKKGHFTEYDRIECADGVERSAAEVASGRIGVTDVVETEAGTGEFDMKYAEDTFNELLAFQGYGFCSAHALCYGVYSAVQLWLQEHYFLEYMSVMLSHVGRGDKDKKTGESMLDARVRYAISNGISVLYPDVNRSTDRWEISGATLLAPLKNIKGFSEADMQTVAKGRPYGSIRDFMDRTKMGKGKFEALLFANAFSSFGDVETIYNWYYNDYTNKSKKKDSMGFFDFGEEFEEPSQEMSEVHFDGNELDDASMEYNGFVIDDNLISKYHDVYEDGIRHFRDDGQKRRILTIGQAVRESMERPQDSDSDEEVCLNAFVLAKVRSMEYVSGKWNGFYQITLTDGQDFLSFREYNSSRAEQFRRGHEYVVPLYFRNGRPCISFEIEKNELIDLTIVSA